MINASTFIERHRAAILEQWYDEASRAASARGLERPELANIMPSYVTALGSAHDNLGELVSARRRQVEQHLACRLRLGFVLEEIVDEFLLLGRCVERSSDEEPRADERPSRSEIERLWVEVRRAAAAVTDMFTAHMAQDEQTEKRYGRRLRELADAALRNGAPPLKERLTDALALIVDAMGAAGATLLLYHPESRGLVAVASTGIESLDDYVASFDLSSFAGKVASSEETIALEDAETSALAIADSLRHSGIHAVLGVRLPAHDTLLGVLYVGLREVRPFTPREARRLEALGEQLTVHLDNARLFAERADQVAELRVERELRERFVSVLAHDLRGPLAAAKMAVQVLMEPPCVPPHQVETRRRELLERIDRSIDRTDRMVRALLDANRVHAGERLALDLGECDLATIVREVASELADIHGERFLVEVDEHVRGFWDADQLRRAIWNLATNAVKYGATKSPIGIKACEREGGVEVSVHNEGPPIAAAQQQRLFGAFTRGTGASGTGASAGEPGGWGLGLTLVRGCAEAHGGTIHVQSDAATGTTFLLRLPSDARPFQPRESPHFRHSLPSPQSRQSEHPPQ